MTHVLDRSHFEWTVRHSWPFLYESQERLREAIRLFRAIDEVRSPEPAVGLALPTEAHRVDQPNQDTSVILGIGFALEVFALHIHMNDEHGWFV